MHTGKGQTLAYRVTPEKTLVDDALKKETGTWSLAVCSPSKHGQKIQRKEIE